MATLISGSTGVNKITDGTIVDADINASAAIAGTKLVMPTGSVLQVTQATDVTQTSSTSSGDVNFLSHAITPSASSSKVLVSCNFFIGAGNNETYYLMRGSTKIAGVGTGGGSFISVGSWMNIDSPMAHNNNTMVPVHFEYLDSPSTTSATTYYVGHMSPTGSSDTFFINRAQANTTAARGTMTMTLTEIAG
jgi:hypothetical protein